MADIYLREWTDDKPNGQTTYSFATKMTDFKNPYSKKSLKEIIINFDTGESDVGDTAYLFVYGRDRLESEYSFIAGKTWAYGTSGVSGTSGSISGHRMKFNINLTDIYTYQFNFVFAGTAKIGFNDINVTYREYRDSSTDKLAGD